ncbi:MAG: enoyl-CoA hydratase/isomerase family protein [Nitrososphaerota archaeon]|nr:enoyl-CoA hydratase/isomerase family protein [Candidatus Bathyarchaeota archaeon]MDW8022741.1 enoyl-CoA hydratase/isomerase family protein [Nitrososphaerota archaeon]
MSYKNIIYESVGGCARITINRPPLNIVNIETLIELDAALEKAKKDPSAAVVIITSAGEKAFSAGLDVKDHLPDKISEALNAFNKVFYMLRDVDKPTLAVVKGYALGGGCELAIGCDMIVASENAQFGLPEITVGVMPPVAIALLPRLIGRKKAFELILTGDTISAVEAKQIGLVNAVAPAEKLEETVKVLIEKLKSKSPAVLKIARKALYEGFDLEFSKALEKVTEIYLKTLMQTEDALEGLKAFLEKRKPVWKGK